MTFPVFYPQSTQVASLIGGTFRMTFSRSAIYILYFATDLFGPPETFFTSLMKLVKHEALTTSELVFQWEAPGSIFILVTLEI